MGDVSERNSKLNLPKRVSDLGPKDIEKKKKIHMTLIEIPK